MTEQEVDLVRRDPNELNSHVKVAFEDVLGEPDGAHSIDCVWNLSYKCFNGGKNCCYKLLTTLCGLCIALYWGCMFAQITFEQVWCVTPGLRTCSIYAGCCQIYWHFCAMLLSTNMRDMWINFQQNKYVEKVMRRLDL
ncbi:caveolin 3 [Mytilus galloprovincialis]|uniref:Caveolin n=1 Tax=Mytilus galloprovincialis TaxID=29158 RepID=A0A8B6G7F9_MYTGA|nr:caveolin 3 [Mytilus galloprovincialis]